MNYKPLRVEDVKYLVVHCSATPPSRNIGVTEIDRMHRERGFFEIGYHFVIRRNGWVEEGRALDKPGAHAVGFNQSSVAICLVGGVDENMKSSPNLPPEANYTPEQIASMRVLLRQLKRMYPNAEILGHRDLPAKTPIKKDCPCFDIRAYFRADPLLPDTHMQCFR